jgi:hypothetical protein
MDTGFRRYDGSPRANPPPNVLAQLFSRTRHKIHEGRNDDFSKPFGFFAMTVNFSVKPASRTESTRLY